MPHIYSLKQNKKKKKKRKTMYQIDALIGCEVSDNDQLNKCVIFFSILMEL